MTAEIHILDRARVKSGMRQALAASGPPKKPNGASPELKASLKEGAPKVIPDLRPQDYFLAMANHLDFGPTHAERFVKAIGQHITKHGLDATLNGLRRHWYDAQRPENKS